MIIIIECPKCKAKHQLAKKKETIHILNKKQNQFSEHQVFTINQKDTINQKVTTVGHKLKFLKKTFYWY